MEIFYKNGKSDTLDKRHFLASGGEGQVYLKGGMVYKIYISNKNVIPEKKISELSVLSAPNIIKPNELIYDNNRKAIGYTMNAVKDTISLCQVFTRAYKDRVGIDHKNILNLVEELRNGVEHCHKNNILIVDLNELNFLVDTKFHKNVYFIDVDSYQTPSFPATAIMESIRDRHNKKFSEVTDWFSFAVISFQMFIGIHPFKGKHPTLLNLDDRMNANVSVLNKDVSFPKICMPFSVIPKHYYDWYVRVFERGERIPPMTMGGSVIVMVAPKVIVASNKSFKVEDMFSVFNERVVAYNCVDGKDLITLETQFLFNNRAYTKHANSVYGVSNKNKVVVEAYEEASKIKLHGINPIMDIDLDVNVDALFGYEDRIYAKCDDVINEVQLMDVGSKIIASMKQVCNVMPNSTQTFPGCAIQNMLGNYFISLFPGAGLHYQLKLEELEGYKIIDAKYMNRVAIVIGAKKGSYTRFIIRFSKDYQTYDVRKTNNLQHNDINFVCLSSGVCVMVNENDFTEVFFHTIGDNRIRLVEDDFLSDKPLFCRDTTLMVADEKQIKKISLV
jgi:serine/threonine protein kinase